MMKKYVIASIIFLTAFLLVGLSSTWSYEANFTYTPGDSLKKGAPSNSIVVGGVNYRTNMKVRWAGLPQLAKFDGAMKTDLKKILTSKGLIVADQGMYLMPVMEINAGGPPVYSLSDVILKIEGKLTLELKQSVDGGVLWSTSVPFTLASFQEPGFWKRVNSLTWKERNAQQTINNTSVAKTIDTAELSSEGMDEVVRGLEMQYSGLMGDLAKTIDAKAIRAAAKGN